MMADIAKVKRNIQRMIDQGAPEADIDAYVSSEGTTPDELRGTAKPKSNPVVMMDPRMQELSTLTQNADPNAGAKVEFQAMSPLRQLRTSVSDAVNLGINGASLGFGNKAAAGLRSAFSDKSYDEELAAMHAQAVQARARQGAGGALAEIGGSVLGLGKLSGLGMTANRLIPAALTGGKKLAALMGAGVVDGTVINEAMNVGNDRAFGENAGFAAIAGGLAPAVVAGGGKVIDTVKGAFGKGNTPRAASAIRKALERSGKSVDDIAADMAHARSDGQDVYTLADSLGNSGQRMLAGTLRLPGEARQAATEQLLSRQSGQADRLTNAVTEGFDTPLTAVQKTKALTKSRRAAGAANYGAARANAGAVDTSGAIAAIDDIVSPGISRMTGAGANDSGVYATLSTARSLLTNGKTTVSDFDRALMAKIEMDKIIEAGGTTANLLRPARQALDDALAKSSAPYAKARDAYRQGSKEIDAVETGTMAQSGRARSQDTIPQFNALSDAEKAAFRTGYTDPMIAKIQGNASGTLVDKSRALISPKTGAEFPTFAAAGKADQLGRRIAREKTMFQTNSQALGGSATAQNLADMADAGTFDSGMIMNLLSGNLGAAAKQGGMMALSAIQGRNTGTRDLIIKALTSTGSKPALEAAKAIEAGKQLTQKQQAIARGILASVLPMLPQN